MESKWLDDNSAISADRLKTEGVYYDRVPLEESAYQPVMDALKTDGGYIHQDQVELRPDMPNLPELLVKFDGEHLHDEDEVRFVLEGEAIFDIRSSDDRWMRVKVEAGDLIVVPGGRYHRFELTDAKNIRCVRLFQDPTGWIAKYRKDRESALSSTSPRA